MYLLAIIFPPLAVLMCKKPFQCLINLILCLFFLVPGIVHALLLVREYKANEMMVKQVRLMKETMNG